MLENVNELQYFEVSRHVTFWFRVRSNGIENPTVSLSNFQSIDVSEWFIFNISWIPGLIHSMYFLYSDFVFFFLT